MELEWVGVNRDKSKWVGMGWWGLTGISLDVLKWIAIGRVLQVCVERLQGWAQEQAAADAPANGRGGPAAV